MHMHKHVNQIISRKFRLFVNGYNIKNKLSNDQMVEQSL